MSENAIAEVPPHCGDETKISANDPLFNGGQRSDPTGSSIRAAQPITDSGFGQDELRAFVVGFNFLSEQPNKDANDIIAIQSPSDGPNPPTTSSNQSSASVSPMHPEEGSPSLAGRSPSFDHVLGDARLRDFKPELEQYAVDAWRAPKRIFDAHPPDQYA
jgi:hypothetical protein